jgi:hypothetical protein
MKKIIIASLCSICAIALVSCEGSYVVTDRPVAPAYAQTVAPGPDYVWIDGDWFWEGGRYTWHNGYWDHPHPGRHWEAGGWETRGNGYSWRRGRWR